MMKHQERHYLAGAGSGIDTVSALALEIRRARKDAGLTQGELADLAEVSERTVRALETATGNPSLRAVASVLNVLGLKIGVGR
ncbi:helix-turn-helix domain-containing protein [Arthrobacter sp. UCD-GKA]|uniref:helix-turn-helix transcriptional regulator n=1 Tax=Arthrobacter sp. UCD-GKA TaxID=1913576 RepID=UPI000AF7D430|nr:helix-turn-helix domain-containing protein [Arthrobacter sp. UCD-GKA]